ncbi:MAG: FtsX-like permease family protein [Chloroflexota bacterium]
MIIKYIIKNFRRRKVRTILMMLALMISTGLIVAMSATVESVRQSNVELIASGVGRYDLQFQKKETDQEPFIEVSQTSERILGSSESVTAVYPRIDTDVALRGNGNEATGRLIALDQAIDTVGFIDVVEGEYTLGNRQVALLEATATSFDLSVGDQIEVAYSFPQPREEGKTSPAGSSQRQAVDIFTISSIVRQDGVTDSGVRGGLIMSLDDAQVWLGLDNRAERLIALVDPALYEERNAENAALNVRNVAVAVQNELGEQYQYSLTKAAILDQSAQAFLILQALINTYGIMSLGVVGLLVHTLVMTNVQEQKREMAILRILGSERGYLFRLVIGEVLIVGIIGIGLGVVLGQIINQYLIVPFIVRTLTMEGLVARLQPSVNLVSILPAIISASAVLFFSALRPAQEASTTKVMHAINPGVADNIQIEDITNLRERRPNNRFLIFGFMLILSVLMTIGLSVSDTFGNEVFSATVFLAAFLMMVLGIGLIFFITTVPFEKLVLFVLTSVAPRLTFFARRNVSRNQARNTLISMLVLFSGVLPSFLATDSAISNANIETDVRLDSGADLELQTFSRFGDPAFADLSRLDGQFINDELPAIDGLEHVVGLTYDYSTQVTDSVGMRQGSINLVGVSDSLNNVLFSEFIIMTAGGTASLDEILVDDTAVVISEGLALGLAIPLGGKIQMTGEGLDHVEELTVVGIARRLPGFSNIGRVKSQGLSGSTVLISVDGFKQVTSDPQVGLPPANARLFDRVLASVAPDADPNVVIEDMSRQFGGEYDFWIDSVDVSLEFARTGRVQEQAFLLVMTLISFTTAVFGVFAVIYVTIYARRIEIGMMKAMGTRNWELTGMLIVESIAMTVSAALAGIVAGGTMGYLIAYMENLTAQRPMQFAIDTTVMPFIVILVVFASILGTAFSARRIVKRKAVEILRM